MEQEIEKNFFLFLIIAFEFGVANSHNLEEEIANRSQSVNNHH